MPPGPPHEEKHLAQEELLRDLVTGATDGLVLPFALAAALAAAGAAHPLVVAAGLAAAAAGGVAAGLGAHLAARAEAEHYKAERRREEQETHEYPERERWEVAAILHRYGVRGDALRLAVESICSDRRRWVDFMMRFELDLREPQPERAAQSAATIGAAHLAGGLMPLAPYLLFGATAPAVALSAGLTALALAGLGWLKAGASGAPPVRGATRALAVGGGAAAAAFLVAGALGG
jgi:VIT1/CCC1 family predicted Fe2+/Mn2+ transporter